MNMLERLLMLYLPKSITSLQYYQRVENAFVKDNIIISQYMSYNVQLLFY